MSKDEQLIIPEEYLGRDVGQLAEDVLRTWVSEKTALTINFAHMDKEGWDFILEFPSLTPEKGQPWDTAPPRIQCWVQVKGTVSDAKKRNVKLDNWHKLIDTPLPAFFLICEFDPEGLRAAYLVHVHGTWMERVLKRLRETRQGESPPLRKQHVSLTWSEEDKLDPANGVGLIRAILKYIGDDFDAYVQEKQRTRRELGLDAPFIMHIRGKEYASRDEMFAEMVPFALGKEELLFNVAVEKDVRFGIASDVIAEHEAFLTALPEGTAATLTFRATAGRRAAIFPCQVFSPHYFFPGTDIPEKHKKYRITYPLGELIFGASGDPPSVRKTGEFPLQLDLSPRPIEIHELVNTWRAISLLAAATHNPVSVELEVEGRPAANIATIQEVDLPELYIRIAQAVEDAWFLVRHLDWPVKDLQVTLEEIAKQAAEFRDIRILLERKHPPFRTVTGTLTKPSTEPERPHAMLFGRTVNIGNHRILVAVGMGGPFRTGDDGLKFEIAPLMPINTKTLILSDGITIRDAVATMSTELTQEGYVFLGIEPSFPDWAEEE